MEKITYLLGAGASANALPLIKKGNDKTKLGLPEELKEFVQNHKGGILQGYKDWTSLEFKNLENITSRCIEFGTPDLYAKYLLETGDKKNYELLKYLLSSFFKTKQEYYEAFDTRALSFLTTISSNQQLPENVHIISWNYDTQIEIAATKLRLYTNNSSSVIKGFSCWPNHTQGLLFENNPFLFHINGIAGFRYINNGVPEKFNSIYHFPKEENSKILLSFAWETEDSVEKNFFLEKRIDLVKKNSAGTTILVVIGYSFPFFNRNIDKEIINSMRPTLNKVYFQDPNSDGSNLINLFGLQLLGLSNITHIKQVENYHIPYEL